MACRRTAPKAELVRVALAARDGRTPPLAVLDRESRLGGRGAYVCRTPGSAEPSPECLAAALERGGFARALRAKVTLDPKLVESVGR